MNTQKVTQCLSVLAIRAAEIAATCEREGLEPFDKVWRGIAQEADQLAAAVPSSKEVLDFSQDAGRLFGYLPGEFMDVYIERSDPDELARENERFDQLKRDTRAIVGQLHDAASEGEFSDIRLRRALVDIETTLLELGMDNTASAIKAWLQADPPDYNSASVLIREFASRGWRADAEQKIQPKVDEAAAELGKLPSRTTH